MKVAKGHLAMESPILSGKDTYKQRYKVGEISSTRLHIYTKCTLIMYTKNVSISDGATYLHIHASGHGPDVRCMCLYL